MKISIEQCRALEVSLPIFESFIDVQKIELPTDTSDEGLKAYAIQTSIRIEASQKSHEILAKIRKLIEETKLQELEDEEKRSAEHEAQREEENRQVGVNI